MRSMAEVRHGRGVRTMRIVAAVGIVGAVLIATYCAMHYDAPHTMAGHSLALVTLVLLGRWYERLHPRCPPAPTSATITDPPSPAGPPP